MLSTRQFQEWQEYYRVEPWGFYVDDHRYSVIASSIYRAMGGKAKAEDFTYQPEQEEPSAQEFAQTLKAMLGIKEADSG